MADHTKELTDEIEVEESPARSGNNIKMELSDSIICEATLTSAYKIFRKGDTAFMRSDIP